MWGHEAEGWIPLVCLFAGLFAGMFGVGGGLIKGECVLSAVVLSGAA